MKSFGIIGLVAVVLAIIAAANTFFVVDQRYQTLVLQVGKAQKVYNAPGNDEAGLKMKIPFIQSTVTYDKRNLGVDIPDIKVIASDQEQLLVDAFVRWRIDDPLQFYQRFTTMAEARRQLGPITDAAIRNSLAETPSNDIISGQRAKLMDVIRETVANDVKDDGVDIIDVRIRRADYLPEISQAVYAEMREDRDRVATRTRAEGTREVLDIRADAEATARVIVAKAEEQAQIIKGEGDAKRNEIYAEAYEKDAEFFRFQRALLACEKAYIPEPGSGKLATQIVVAPDNMGLCDEFIRRARDNGTPRN